MEPIAKTIISDKLPESKIISFEKMDDDRSEKQSAFRFEPARSAHPSFAQLAINNFIKTLDEIEAEFMRMIKGPNSSEEEMWNYLEQNY